MLKNFKPRLYQETILATAANHNTLVVLPTGMGKTAVSMMLAVQRLEQHPESKILILAPTRPLVDQHIETFYKFLEVNREKMAVFTGKVKPEKRAELWKKSKIIFSTPQGLENDIISGGIELKDISLMVFDEAHRATGDYAYVFIAKQYYKKADFPRILGLTASPGSDLDKIKDINENLFIDKVEVRTEKDPDVKPYIKDIKINWIKVRLTPPFKEVQKFLKNIIKDRLSKLKKWGILKRKNLKYINKRDLLRLQGQLRGRAASGEKDYVLWNAISVLAELMKVQHALGLLETQGVEALYEYMKKLQKDASSSKTKAVKKVVKDLNFRSALIKTKKMYEEGFQHPKLIKLQQIVEKEIQKNKKTKIIIFNNFRDNAKNIVEEINKLNDVSARLFVGQRKKKNSGMSQKEQKQMLEEFRENKFNFLVATSVGEEGLDIPKVDLVIFYEPVPSAIRHIQRRGRTGRQEKGRVLVLMAEDTRDVGYRWSAHHKEKRMNRNLQKLRSKLKISSEKKVQRKLTDTQENKDIKIFADHREKGSGLIKQLIDLGINIKLDKLDSADYVLSSRCGVEFKSVKDFADSIVDGRLLEQMKLLKKNFECPLVIVEGGEDLFSARNIHPNAIRGMLATIAVSYKIPILFTKHPKESASLISIIAKREQEEKGNNYSRHTDKKSYSIKEQQEYVVGAFPNVGPALAKSLLKEMGSIKKIVNSTEEELKKANKIGKKKAKDIKKIVDSDYLP